MPREGGQGGGGRGGKRKKVNNNMDLHQQQQVMGMGNFAPLFMSTAQPVDVARALGLPPQEVPVAHQNHDYEPVGIFIGKVARRISEILAPTHLQEAMMVEYSPMTKKAGAKKKRAAQQAAQAAAAAQAAQQQQQFSDHHMVYSNAAALQHRPMDMSMHHHHQQQHHGHHLGGEVEVPGVAGEDGKKARAKFPHEYGELLRAEIHKNPNTKPKELQAWLKTVLIEKNGRLPPDFPDDKKIATKIANLKTSLRKRSESGR